MKIIPFQLEHIPSAADLLVKQFSCLIEKFPLLPKRTTKLEAAKSFLTAILNHPNTQAMIALDGNRVIGYMLGSYGRNLFFDSHVWVPLGGFALHEIGDLDLLRNLYSVTGDLWVQENVLNHYIVCPDVTNWQQAFFSLSFGQEQAYAIASAKGKEKLVEPPAGIILREIQPNDTGQMFAKAHWISEHLNKAPVWEPVPAEHLANTRPIYAEMANDPASTTWVALAEDKIVAYACIYQVAVGDEHLVGRSRAAHFGAAATDPEYRNQGIGRALFTHILNVAHEQGFEIVFTDWRTTNISAGRYWPSYGFEPFAYRLLRRVNPIYAPFHAE